MYPRRAKEAPIEPDLPITPMLDMAFQLLVFFIFSYKPSAFEGQMEMMLPAAGAARAADPDMVDPKKDPDTDVELPAQVTVIATAHPDRPSEIAQMAVETLAGRAEVRDLRELESYLKRVKDDQLEGSEDIKVQGDSSITVGAMIQVMDTCRLAGFKNVGFSPPTE